MSSLFHPVSALLEKLSKRGTDSVQLDVDLRFMCLRDLAAELNRMRQAQLQHHHHATHAPTATAAAPVPMMAPLDATAQGRLCKIMAGEVMASQAEVHEAALACVPGLLSCVGVSSLLPLADTLLSHIFQPATALPPVHLDSEEMEDEREREARLESLRMKAINTVRAIWRELTAEEVRAQVAKRVLPPVIKVIHQTTDGKAAAVAAASSVAPQLFALPMPHLSNAQLNDFVGFLHSLLVAHPTSIVPYHSAILDLLHSLLLYPGSGLLKLTLECLTSVAGYLTDDLQQSFAARLLQSWPLFQQQKREQSFFSATTILIRVVGIRYQPFTGQLVPSIRLLIVDETGRYDDREDDREAALLCLEALIRHSAAGILPQLPSFLSIIQRAVAHDPNFVGDEEEKAPPSARMTDVRKDEPEEDDGEEEDYGLHGGSDDEDMDGGGGDGSDNDADAIQNSYVDDGGGEDDAGDDDDGSWKVRRAAARCIQAVLTVLEGATGTSSEQQQQANESSLPRLFVHTHAVNLRPMLYQTAAALAHLLLPRLTERVDYIQVELIEQYQELLTWSTRVASDELPAATLLATSTGVSLQSQLTRMLASPIKARPSGADIRKLEAITALAGATLQLAPASMWTAEHARFFSLVSARLGECIEQLSTASPHLPLLSSSCHLVRLVESAWKHAPCAAWQSEAGPWVHLLHRWLAHGSERDRQSTAPTLQLTQACVRAAIALSAPLSVESVDAKSSRTNLERCLAEAHTVRADKLTKSVPGVDALGQQVQSILLTPHADRQLLALAARFVGRFFRWVDSASSSSNATAAAATTTSALLDVLARLCEHASSRVGACESVHDLVHSACVTPRGPQWLHLLQLLAPLIKQRDRTLLRAALLCLHSFTVRLLQSAESSEEFAPVLLQLARSLIELVGDAMGDSLEVEQACSLVVLSNVCLLLARAPSASATSMRAFVSSLVVPAVSAHLHQRAEHAHHQATFQATVGALHVAMGALYTNEKERESCAQKMRQFAVEATNEDVRSLLGVGLGHFFVGSYLIRALPYVDLAQQPCTAVDSAPANQQIDDVIQRELHQAMASEANAVSRAVSFLSVGPLLAAAASSSSRASLPGVLSAAGEVASANGTPLTVRRGASELIGIATAATETAEPLQAMWHAHPTEYVLRSLHQYFAHLPLGTAASALHRCFPTIVTTILAAATALPTTTVELAAAVLIEVARIDADTTLAQLAASSADGSLSANAARVVMEFLRRWLETQHELAHRWQLQLPSLSKATESTVRQMYTNTLAYWSHADLAVVLAAVALARTFCVTQPAMARTVIPAVVQQIAPVVKVQSRYVTSVRYGPSVREFDSGVELRQLVWSCMDVFLSVGKEAASAWPERSTAVVDLLLDGLAEPAAEVRLRILGAIVPAAFERSGVEPTPSQWSAVSDRLLVILESAPPAQAVREERIAHEEGRRSATRAADLCRQAMQASANWPHRRHEADQLKAVADRLTTAVAAYTAAHAGMEGAEA